MERTIGLILLLIATFGFGFLVYWFDSGLLDIENEISDKEENIRTMLNQFNTNIKPLAGRSDSLRDTIAILKSLPPNQAVQDRITERTALRKQLDMDYLFMIYSMTKKDQPTDELKNKWSNMTFVEVQKEKQAYDKDFIDMMNNLQTSKNKLKQKLSSCRHKKLCMIFFLVVFQILGLLLTFGGPRS